MGVRISIGSVEVPAGGEQSRRSSREYHPSDPEALTNDSVLDQRVQGTLSMRAARPQIVCNPALGPQSRGTKVNSASISISASSVREMKHFRRPCQCSFRRFSGESETNVIRLSEMASLAPNIAIHASLL